MSINSSLAPPGQERQKPDEKKGRGIHVLVMALSTFPASRKVLYEGSEREETELRETAYFYEGFDPKRGLDKKQCGSFYHICNGYYQLEPVSWFIKKEMAEYVTDVVLLETEAVRKERDYVIPSPYFPRPDPETGKKETGSAVSGAGQQDGTPNRPQNRNQTAAAGGENLPRTSPSALEKKTRWSAAEYFETWLKEFWGKDLVVHHIHIDERNPAGALGLVTDAIRELYENTPDKDSWRLWMDTHGGFRDISMVLISAARFFATDEKQPIDTNGIFSVYHSQEKEEGKPAGDLIIDQTAFYFTESADALKRFLDYGQYLAHKFQPYGGEKKHAFVSYRHDPAFLTSIRSIFTNFEKHGVLYWYDDGIRYRSNWKEELEKQNMRSDAFIALLSNSYFESVECWKELVRAVAGRKNDFDKFHCVLLEKDVRIPESPASCRLSNREKEEIRKLQEELDVTDENLCDCLGIGPHNNNVQWIKWYEYMDRNSTIRQRTPEDEDGQIREVFTEIREAINR